MIKKLFPALLLLIPTLAFGVGEDRFPGGGGGDPLASGSDGDSVIVQSDSGLEKIGSSLSLLRGCADNEILKWDETNGQDDWNCEADAGAAGGDSITVDAIPVVDPDFNDGGDIGFTDTTNTVTADINAGVIIETDLDGDNAPDDADFLQYDSTGTNFVWRDATETKTDLSLSNVEDTALSTWAGSTNLLTLGTDSVDANELVDGSVDETELQAVLTFNATDHIDLSGVDSSTTFEGLTLPQHATACATGFSEGQVCWEADANILHIGDDAAFADFPSAGAISSDLNISGTGVATIQANAVDSAEINVGAVDEDHLAATLAFDNDDFLDFTAEEIASTSEGIYLPGHTSSCASATGEGQVCWDRDDDSVTGLWIGDGTTVRNIGAGGTPALTDITDPAGDTSLTAADTEEIAFVMSTTGVVPTFVIDFDQPDDADATDTSEALRLDITSESGDAGDTLKGLGIVFENGTANTILDAGISIDNEETTASTMTDGIIITSSGVNAGVTDAIDVSAANITNALNIGSNDIVHTGGTVTTTDLDIIDDGQIDENDIAATLAFDNDDFLDFSAEEIASTSEGIYLPGHTSSCASATGEGQVCWDRDDDSVTGLWIGDGTTVRNIGAGGTPALTDVTDPVGDTSLTFADGEELIFVQSTTGVVPTTVINFDQPDDADATDTSEALRLDITSESGDTGDTLTGLGIVFEEGTANTIMDAGISIDNEETTASTMTDAIIITSSGVDDGVVDAIDASAANITNALNIGLNKIVSTNCTFSDDGTNLDSTCPMTATSFTADASPTPNLLLIDSTTSGKGRIDVDDAAGPEAIMTFWVDTGAGTLTKYVELDGVNNDIELGTPGTNYVDITTAGVMTFVGGSADIDLPANSVDTADITALNVTEDKLAATLAFDNDDFLDFSAEEIASTSEGIYLPGHTSSCASATGEGQVCWDRDDDSVTGLWIGDGTTARNIGSGGSPALTDVTAPVGDVGFTFTDGEEITWTQSTAGLVPTFVIDFDQPDDADATDTSEVLRLDITSESGDTGDTLTGLGIVFENGTANTILDAGISIDNEETTASTMTDAIIITSSGVSGGVVDAIDVSAANITNALNIGSNDIVHTGGTVTTTDLDIIDDGQIDENDIAATLAFDNDDFLDFSAEEIASTSEGIYLPGHTSSCASATGEGQICWDRDDDSVTALWVGDGTVARNVSAGGGTPALSDITAPSGDVGFTFTDGEEIIWTQSTTGLVPTFVIDFDQPDDADATDTSEALRLDITSESGDTGDTLIGLGIVFEEGTANTIMDAAISIDNEETTVSTMTDAIIVTSSGVSGGVVDAIDVSAANITNAINIGSNDIITGAGTIASTELDLLTGKTGTLIDDNDTSAGLTTLTGTTLTLGDGGDFTTVTVDAGATDPVLTFGSDSLAITNAATFTSEGNVVLTAASTIDATTALALIRQVEVDLDADAWVLHGTTPPTANTYGTTFPRNVLSFADGGDDHIGIRIGIPASYDNSVDPTLQIDWTSSATSSGACWCVETATIADSGDTTPAALDTDCLNTTVDATTTDLNETVITITAADFTAGQEQVIRVYRDVDAGDAGCSADALGADADYHTALLTYQVSE